jgi:hypothetical protein
MGEKLKRAETRHINRSVVEDRLLCQMSEKKDISA